MSDTATAPAGLGAALQVRHLRSASDLELPLIDSLLAAASGFARGESQTTGRLAGRVLATIFYEPSTRTRFSFESAMLRLGGQVISAENALKASSVSKGESLEDTMRIIGCYADAIVLRHPEVGAAERAASVSAVPLINAGDGAGQHPTQALLDLFTIKSELGRLDHLRIAMAGDLLHGRTVRSLALLLSRFAGVELILVSPAALRMRDDVLQEIASRGLRYRETANLSDVVGDLDVLYQTRIQAERFESVEEYERHRRVYIVDPALMRRLPEHAIVMHPLPRLDEIHPLVDADPRAAYFRQARNGLYVRMAVLDWAMGR